MRLLSVVHRLVLTVVWDLHEIVGRILAKGKLTILPIYLKEKKEETSHQKEQSLLRVKKILGRNRYRAYQRKAAKKRLLWVFWRRKDGPDYRLRSKYSYQGQKGDSGLEAQAAARSGQQYHLLGCPRKTRWENYLHRFKYRALRSLLGAQPKSASTGVKTISF
jgi:hypothetical protein